MKLIIDIDEEMYKDANILIVKDFPILKKAIAEGIPLPKGHRRLIAEPTEEDIAKTIGGQNDFAESIREAVKTVFDNAPTIIEDKEVENEISN